jgi:hypothetical protein
MGYVLKHKGINDRNDTSAAGFRKTYSPNDLGRAAFRRRMVHSRFSDLDRLYDAVPATKNLVVILPRRFGVSVSCSS